MKFSTFLLTASLTLASALPSVAAPAGQLRNAPNMDDIIYEVPEGRLDMLSRDCDGFTVEAWEASHGMVYGSIVRMVSTDDGEVYFANPVSEYPVQSWIRGVREGSTIVIEGAQPIYEDYDWETDMEIRVYLVPMTIVVDANNQGTYVPAEDLRYVFNVAEDGTISSADPDMLLGVCTYGPASNDPDDYNYVWGGRGDRRITMTVADWRTVSLPEGAAVESWVRSDNDRVSLVNVCIDGSDMYVSGMNPRLPESWVKGTIEGDKVTFPSGQYLGPDYEAGFFTYMSGADVDYRPNAETGDTERVVTLTDAAVFSYNAEENLLVLETGYAVNTSLSHLYALDVYDDVTIEVQHRNPDAAPAAPYDLVYEDSDWGPKIWVQIPNTDVDGNLLDVSKLYYQVLLDGEPLVFNPESYFDFEEPVDMIPYELNGFDVYMDGTDHTVYLYDLPENTIGVRSVYFNEKGDTLYSAAATTATSAIDAVETARTVVGEQWHDISGRRIARPDKGIAIHTVIYSDGTVSHRKVALTR